MRLNGVGVVVRLTKSPRGEKIIGTARAAYLRPGLEAVGLSPDPNLDIKMHRTVYIFMVLEMSGGVAGLRGIRNAKDCYHFHGFGSAREGCAWLQTHK